MPTTFFRTHMSASLWEWLFFISKKSDRIPNPYKHSYEYLSNITNYTTHIEPTKTMKISMQTNVSSDVLVTADIFVLVADIYVHFGMLFGISGHICPVEY